MKLVIAICLLLPLLLSCGKNNNSRPENVGYGITLLRNSVDIPSACKAAFVALSGEKRFEMANPGDRYQEADVVREKGLPWRRLIFAAVRQKRCAIEYEKGGIGKSIHLVILDTSTKPATFVWGGPQVIQSNDIAGLREKLTSQAPADAHSRSLQQYW